MFGVDTITNGITTGYRAGNLQFIRNFWAGVPNYGEIGVYGSFFERSTDATVVDVYGNGNGVAVDDNATGLGFLMYTDEEVANRFNSIPGNAIHFIAVRDNGGQWQYNSNSAWIDFTPVGTDILVAAVDFSADTVTSLENTNSIINGIRSGFFHSDLVFTANRWAGSKNSGEFEVLGYEFYLYPGLPVGDTGYGIAVDDSATGQGYLMYSSQVVHSRFAGMNFDNADHFAAVRLLGDQWQVNNDTTWLNFDPMDDDLLIAMVDFDNDTVDSFEGLDAVFGGIQAGYVEGNLDFFSDSWNGAFDDGEFAIEGDYFVNEAG